MIVFACMIGEDVVLVSWDRGLANECLKDNGCDSIVEVDTMLGYDEVGDLMDSDELTLEALEFGRF